MLISPLGWVAVAYCASAIVGDTSDASWWLDDAVRRFDAEGMSGRAAAARWARATLRGGDDGERELEAAKAHFVAHGVVDPERFATTLAPSIALRPPGR